MSLRMAAPYRDPKTGFYYLRQRIPSDLRVKLRGTIIGLPIGDKVYKAKLGPVIQVSLRTNDRNLAKHLHSQADAWLKRYWDAQRQGPKALSHKQAQALAGEFYKLTVAKHEDNPGPVSSWLTAETKALIARVGKTKSDSLCIGAIGTARLERLEPLYGQATEDLLSREGLVVDPGSRLILLQAVGAAFERAASQLRSYAEGDYSPDTQVDRFPPLHRASRPSVADAGASLQATITRWTDVAGSKKAPNTLKRYGASLRSFSDFFPSRAIASLTEDDIWAWAEHRRDHDGIGVGTINSNDLVAVSVVLSWATKRDGGRVLAANPAAGVKLVTPDRPATRSKTFRADEIKAILRAASAVEIDPANPTFSYAKRWCPWLAAYSGARITELTRLSAEDIWNEDGIPVMEFKLTKTRYPRIVPLHQHLIDQGFLDFVERQRRGPLFYDLRRRKEGSTTDQAEIRSRKIAAWVRETTKLDMAIQPDHAWRHTFKTTALEVGIQSRISDAVTGHRPKGVARSYEAPTVRMLHKAMTIYPTYDL